MVSAAGRGRMMDGTADGAWHAVFESFRQKECLSVDIGFPDSICLFLLRIPCFPCRFGGSLEALRFLFCSG